MERSRSCQERTQFFSLYDRCPANRNRFSFLLIFDFLFQGSIPTPSISVSIGSSLSFDFLSTQFDFRFSVSLPGRQWVKEEDLAKDLKLHAKQLRRTLQFFEEEKLVSRDHRRETAKGAKVYNAAVANNQHVKDGGEKIKMHTHSYCCLDYAQIYDVVRYRLHRMKKKLKDEIDNKDTVQEYKCPKCSRRYTALDALQLISIEDEYFHCEKCNGKLVADCDKLVAQEGGDGDDNARRRQREKLKNMLQNMEIQLKPLMEQLNRVKDLHIPEFGTLQAWEARAASYAAVRLLNGANDSSKSALGLSYGGLGSQFFLGETKVEVAFSGVGDQEEDTKSGNGNTSVKVLPPWMIKQGMKLTEEQHGQIRPEMKMQSSSTHADVKEDIKGIVQREDDAEYIKREYLKAYYAAMIKKEEKNTETEKTMTLQNDVPAGLLSDRQVGMKSKRNKNDEDDDGHASKIYKVDLNAQGDDDDDDGSDWEEG